MFTGRHKIPDIKTQKDGTILGVKNLDIEVIRRKTLMPWDIWHNLRKGKREQQPDGYIMQ